MEWTKGKSKEEIENEFSRIAECVRTQGDIDCILDLVPLDNKKEFIDGWHNEDNT